MTRSGVKPITFDELIDCLPKDRRLKIMLRAYQLIMAELERVADEREAQS